MSKNQATIVAVMGASGSGKSLYIKGELRRLNPARLIVWDTLGEYGAHGSAVSSLVEAVASARKSKFKIIFRPTADPARAKQQFDVLCRVAFAAGDCVLVAEELAFVTSPSYAGAGWSECTLKGRHKGLTIYGASQRPAAIDKNFFGNATSIRCGRLNFANDVKVLANVMQVPVIAVQSLAPLEFIQRNMQSGEITSGKIKIGRQAAGAQ